MSVPIPAATHMGAVHLTVADLERSLAYYREYLAREALRHLTHDPSP